MHQASTYYLYSALSGCSINGGSGIPQTLPSFHSFSCVFRKCLALVLNSVKLTLGGGRMLGGRSNREGAGEGRVFQGLTFFKYPVTTKKKQINRIYFCLLKIMDQKVQFCFYSSQQKKKLH